MFEVVPWTRRSVAAIGLLGLIALVPVLATCGSGSTEGRITATQVVTRDTRIPPGPDSLPERIGFRTRPPQPPPVENASPSYTWVLPEGWSELPTSQFRQGNWKIASAPGVETYLSVLPAAGGGALANLNRWRKQMGLPDMAIEEAAKLPTVPVLGQGAALVDFEGTYGGMSGGGGNPGYRLLGLLLLDRGHGVFLKMVGPEAEVAAARDSFLEFARSLKSKRGAEDPHAGHDRGFDPSRLRWTGPEGWEEGPRKTMREVTYRPAGSDGTECYISVLSGTAGGLVANVNRWRDQAGMPELSPAEVEALPRIEVLGTPSTFLEVEGTFRGMSGPEQEGFMLLAVACELPGFSVFVKMTGPTAVVGAERERFLEFCKSLRQVP